MIRSLILLTLLVAGCSPGRKIRPADPTYAGATGQKGVCASDGSSSPLVVDWSPEERADLEAGLRRQAVMVVAYDCHTLRVLPDCELPGGYSYAGLTPKEQVISLKDADEVKANLPRNGAGLVAGLDASRRSTLDVALVLAGRTTASRQSVRRSELTGRCEGATHFVRRATLGAFAMSTGTLGEVKSAATIFGGGLSGDSSSQRSVANRDGSLEACKGADETARTPARGCSSPLRVELLALDTATSAPGKPGDDDLTAVTPACAGNWVYSEGRCTRPGPGMETHECRPGNRSDCTEQCQKGNAPSCNTLGALLSPDVSAVAYFQKACDVSYPSACFNLALSYQKGLGVARDLRLARQLHGKACQLGDGTSCRLLGHLEQKGLGGPVDLPGALRTNERGCSLGDATACNSAGWMYAEGVGTPVDPAQASRRWLRACDGGEPNGCSGLGSWIINHPDGGLGTPAQALDHFERACALQEGQACGNVGGLLQSGKHGVPANKPLAFRRFQQGCQLGDASSCTWEGLMMIAGDGVPKDRAQGISFLERGCKGGDARGCEILSKR